MPKYYCHVCGFTADQRFPWIRRAWWTLHQKFRAPTAWHQRALAVFRVQNGIDPLTGRPEADFWRFHQRDFL